MTEGRLARPVQLPGERVSTMADQVTDDGTVIPQGSTGYIIGWRGDDLVVEWRTPEGEIVVTYPAPSEVMSR